MKKAILSLVLVYALLPLSIQAQGYLKGTYNLDNFPEVSFVWNSPDPKEIESSRFALTEDGEEVEFRYTALSVDGTPLNKSVLILWEDMASHNGQSLMIRQALNRFFQEMSFSHGDRFEVAVFDRTKGGKKTVLEQLCGGFTSDVNRLMEGVRQHKDNTRTYEKEGEPDATDLYKAIGEGLDLLTKEPADSKGVIVVFTKGDNFSSNVGGAISETSPIRDKAKNARIPVYVVKFTHPSNNTNIDGLAKDTYGDAVANPNGVSEVFGALKQFYGQMDSCLRGHDYRFTFTSKAERDGKSHNLVLVVGTEPQSLPVFTIPEPPSTSWMEEHQTLCIVLGVAFVALVSLLCVILSKKRKARINIIQGTIQEQLNQAQNENKEIRRQNHEQIERIRREQEEKERARVAAEEEQRLCQIMKVKNLYPRLQCKMGNDMFSYTVTTPRVKLGRNEDNDVVFSKKTSTFNNQTVSGYHAEIVFDGVTFEIVNKSTTYKNGVIVNGQFYQRCTLRNGDMFGLGEAVITFYL